MNRIESMFPDKGMVNCIARRSRRGMPQIGARAEAEERRNQLDIVGGGSVMEWQPTYHLYFPDMEVCEPDEHSRFLRSTDCRSWAGWQLLSIWDMSNVWAAEFTTSDAAKGAAEKWRANRIKERNAATRDSVSEILSKRKIRMMSEIIYTAPGLDEEYPDIDIDRLVMVYEDYCFVDIVDVIDDYMKGEL